MNYLIQMVDIKEYVDGTLPCPDPTRDPIGTKNWRYNDTCAQMCITNNVSNELNVHTEGCINAHKMYKTLKGMFETPSQQDYTEHLHIIFETRATEGSNILDHLTKLKQTWNKVHIFSEKCKLEDDALFKRIIASTLPRSWDEYTKPYVQGCVDETNKDPNKLVDIQSLIGMIKQKYKADESRRKKEGTTSKNGNGNGNCNNGSCNSNANRSNSSSNDNRTPREEKRCNHCGKDGHWTRKCCYLDKPKCKGCRKFGHAEKDCYSKPGNKRPNSGKDRDGVNKRAKREANNADTNNASDASDADDTTEANIAKQGDDEMEGEHEIIQGEHHAMNAEEEANAVNENAYDNNGEYSDKTPLYNENGDLIYDWLADSGTTSHITHRRDAFATYEPIEQTPIKGVGGVKTYAVGKGTVFLNSECDRKNHTIELRDVLHVPSNRNNLLAAGNWEQCGQYFLGHYSKFTLYTNKNVAIARGVKLSNNLYRMRFKLIPITTPKDYKYSFHVNTSTLSWEMWHRRFSHVGYSGLQRLLDKSMVDGFRVDMWSPRPDCVACTESKHAEKPYRLAEKKDTKLGELTHVDIWGKYETASIHRSHYYVVMIDDASRYVTVEFLKKKSQAGKKITEYMTHQMARGKSPCTIKMDRGSKFVNEELKKWCHSQGICFQMTAPYSPSQNGVAKRMNRTLGELARTMLTASKLPQFLWEPAITHAVYIRNRSYTSARPEMTPYQLWNGKKPNVTHLREFGAPVWILAQGQNVQCKMMPKS